MCVVVCVCACLCVCVCVCVCVGTVCVYIFCGWNFKVPPKKKIDWSCHDVISLFLAGTK